MKVKEVKKWKNEIWSNNENKKQRKKKKNERSNEWMQEDKRKDVKERKKQRSKERNRVKTVKESDEIKCIKCKNQMKLSEERKKTK